MELWACGYNAFNQLQFDGGLPAEPQDIHGFELVLRENRIVVLHTSISATLVQTSSGLRFAGLADELTQICYNDEVRACLSDVAIAGNEKLTELKSGSIIQYGSLESYLAAEGQNFGQFGELKSIVANQTTFTALSSDGKVWTWGDGRYEACLGREATEESPATEPGIVEDLDDLPTGPIVKIASGGYMTAVLTEGSDLYVWGGRPGHPKLFESILGHPEPLDVDGYDFLDVAVGDDHMLVLTTDHRVFVIGTGGNGQLGTRAEKLKYWMEIVLPLSEGQLVVAVYAGYKNSFVLVNDAV